MQTKLQELTEKIYREGVEKAQAEADKILAEARQQAQEIVKQAQVKAEELMQEAEKNADVLRKNSMNELQLAGRQAISDLKQKIVALLEKETLGPQTKAAFGDQQFVQELMISVIKSWDSSGSDSVDLQLMLPKNKQQELDAFIKQKVQGFFEKGLQITWQERMKNGFKIGPKDGGYLVSFTDEDFDNFFVSYLRPLLVELLFGEKQ
ncbi:MAG TPA: HrpE/YscL family type III secretion apparatus protein [Bacteroidales bacterium]|nr:HrpE/YscL family type III secretion apparatus protein [Bacteroidales bacterium]